jgi:ribosomal protein L37AE/L43A
MSREGDRRAEQPTRCPFCQSASITSTNQKLAASTYWRCEQCGQVWHPARLANATLGRRWYT